MLPRVAPIALRMPISRVLSFTAMSMMFETPTTPARSVPMPMTHTNARMPPMRFTKRWNSSTAFEMKTAPNSYFLKKAAKLESGSKNPGRDVAGSITVAQVRQIAETKMPDLNAIDLEGAMRQVEGTARSMGLDVVAGKAEQAAAEQAAAERVAAAEKAAADEAAAAEKAADEGSEANEDAAE